ncbi:hypothetical protein ACFVFS_34695 [Kitasatospora sp. NPDC057692]|uniref:hypothetical protein n=1 Tax=Kitasatospora sp. NPDC057692 TaxID=3346215 RepID=UPI0036C0D688
MASARPASAGRENAPGSDLQTVRDAVETYRTDALARLAHTPMAAAQLEAIPTHPYNQLREAAHRTAFENPRSPSRTSMTASSTATVARATRAVAIPLRLL